MTNRFLRIGAIFALLMSFSFLSAQENPGPDAAQSITSESTTQNQYWSSADYADASGSGASGTGSTVWLFVRMFFSLVVVVGVVYLFFYFLKRGSKAQQTDDPFLRKVAQLNLSPGKSVQIVTILEKAYLLGVTDNAINLIGEIDDKELVNSMNVYSDKNSTEKKPRNFSEILDLFLAGSSKSGGKNGGIFGSSANDAATSLRRQRERFNNGGEE